jgi:nucleotide-binding universal stress UspA family protein
MMYINHILFPVDFSERCCGAVGFVESMAKRYQAKITLLSAVQPFYYGAMGDPGGGVVVDPEELLRDRKETLDSSLTKEFADLRVERVAEIGDPAQVITDFAHTNDVDLIMMPTHGYGPFRSLLLGSVTAKVLHDAKCPVWTAAHVAEPPFRHHIACRNILCAVDGAPNSVLLMKWASELAMDCGATLRLVHVIPGMEGGVARQVDRELEEDFRREARQAVEDLQKSAGVKAPLCVTSGHVADRVREEARRHGADLVVIGRGTLHETLGRLRTHAYGIIRQSPCPVLSV